MRKLAQRVLLLACLLPTLAGGTEEPAYRELDWKDLVPAAWEPPIILPAPRQDGEHHPVDPASLVQDLDGTRISLPGFMIPVKFEGNVVSAFLMVPFLEQHVRAHIHHDPNQMLYVYLGDPVPIQNPYAPVSVKGTIRVQSVETGEGPTGYTIEQASIEPYVYPAPIEGGG